MEVLYKIIDKIKIGTNSDDIVKEIIEILKRFLKESKTQNVVEIKNWFKKIGSTIHQECPNAFPILNVLTRSISILNGMSSLEQRRKSVPSDNKLFQFIGEMKNSKEDKEDLTSTAFRELVDEISSFDTINEEIINIAVEHLEESEVIMVYCQSALMSEFINLAISEKKVSVICILNALGKNFPLNKEIKNVTYITESAVFSLINKVSKIFMDCHAVMADGAIINLSGTFTVATIAKEYSIPVIILSPMYRFTPFYAFAQESYNSFISPHDYFLKAFSLNNLEVLAVKYDVISSDCVSFIITQSGEYSNNYIYQAFSDYYSEEYGYDF